MVIIHRNLWIRGMTSARMLFSLPPEFWNKIRTTYFLDRVNKELKQRSRTIGAFPNEASLLRLAGSLLIGINEEWITGNRYLSGKREMISPDTVAADFTAI
ncbi:MAG: transposase [Methanoregula sp.]|nr:transposase [Methanoregula sp.]